MNKKREAFRDMMEEIKKYISSRAAMRSISSGEDGLAGSEPELHVPESDEPDGDEMGGIPTGGHHENDSDEPSDISPEDFRQVQKARKHTR